jgi:hypothetical protein
MILRTQGEASFHVVEVDEKKLFVDLFKDWKL